MCVTRPYMVTSGHNEQGFSKTHFPVTSPVWTHLCFFKLGGDTETLVTLYMVTSGHNEQGFFQIFQIFRSLLQYGHICVSLN